MNNTAIINELLAGLDLDTPRQIDGLSRYEINLREGTVKDNWRNIVLQPKPNARGYCYLNLMKDNNERLVISVHRLVVLAALDSFDYRKLFRGLNLVIDHKNGDRSDNRFINLAVVSQSKNLEGRKTKPVHLNSEQFKALYNDFKLIDKAKHGEKHNVYQILSEKYNGYSTHSIQVRYLEHCKQSN